MIDLSSWECWELGCWSHRDLEEQHISHLPWPRSSPDLEPIEHVRDEIKRRLIRTENPPQTKQQLLMPHRISEHHLPEVFLTAGQNPYLDRRSNWKYETLSSMLDTKLIELLRTEFFDLCKKNFFYEYSCFCPLITGKKTGWRRSTWQSTRKLRNCNKYLWNQIISDTRNWVIFAFLWFQDSVKLDHI